MLPPSRYHLAFHVALTTCILSTLQCWCLMPPPKIDLEDKSYMLDVLIQSGLELGPNAPRKFEIQELHSAWQARSRLNVLWSRRDEAAERNQESAPVFTIHADKERLLILNPRDTPTCKETSLKFVDQLFELKALKEFNSGHQIGAARLLSFIQANHDKFIQISALAGEQGDDLVYKMMFAGKFEAETANAFTITLFYHEEADKNLPNGIPRMISIKGRTRSITTFTINRYQALKEGHQVQASTSSVEIVDQYRYSHGNEVTLDMFALDPSWLCSTAIVKDQNENNYNQLRSRIRRFSFSARRESAGSKVPRGMTVVYEPALDYLQVHQVLSVTSVNKLTDFRLNRQYHIVKEHSPTDGAPAANRSIQSGQDDTCVVSQIASDASDKKTSLQNRISQNHLGTMLLGTNKLAYLGLARVRGIEAQVYQFHDCGWPMWANQPAVYKEPKSHQNQSNYDELPLILYDDLGTMKKNGISMTNVVYLTKTGTSDDYENILQAKLLLLEIILRHDQTGNVVKKYSFSIFDFEWDLPSSSPAGGRYEDSFSLRNECLADVENGDYATINLLLGAKLEAKQLVWIHDRTRRNLALLQMLQSDLNLEPVSMLYDLESSLTTTGVESTSIRGDPEKPIYLVSLGVTVRMATRKETGPSLVLLGRINIKREFVTAYKVNNFRACYMLAAHHNEHSMFAYRSRNFLCLLVKPEFSSSGGDILGGDLVSSLTKDSHSSRSCGNDELADDELYLVHHHHHEDKMHYSGDKLKTTTELALKRRDHLKIYDQSDLAQIQAHGDTEIKLDIKSAHVVRLDDKESYDVDELHLSDTNKFLGFGLVASDGQNKQIELKDEAGDDQDDELSFEHCKTACLADLECRSFSVCYRQGKTSCIMSHVSFSTPSMALQIMILTDTKAKFGETLPITVDLDEQNYFKSVNTNKGDDNSSKIETIHLVKHGLCELHNKLYRDLFKITDAASLEGIAKHAIWPVAHAEQCSEICFLKTLNFLREQKDRLADMEIRSWSLPSLDKLAYKACDQFFYIERETIDLMEAEKAHLFKKRLEDSVHPDTIGGYCVLDKIDDDRVKNDSDKSLRHDDETFVGRIPGQQYEFDYTSLFTKQFGVSLVESPLSAAARRALYLDNHNPRGIPEIKSNENYGRIYHITSNQGEHVCAKECFWASFRFAYPYCLSYDSFVITHPRSFTRRKCGFNSITLASAIKANRTDLIRIGSDKQERIRVSDEKRVLVWHYELRPGLVADSVKVMHKIQLAEDIRASTASASQLEVHIGGFKLFCGLVIVLSLGVAIGLTMGPKLLAGEQSMSGDKNQLIEDRMDSFNLRKVELGSPIESNGQS